MSDNAAVHETSHQEESVWNIHRSHLHSDLSERGITYYGAVALSAFVFLEELLVTDLDRPGVRGDIPCTCRVVVKHLVF